MKLITTYLLTIALVSVSLTSTAKEAKNEKQAKRAAELRQSVFKLLGNNMGPLGAMAKGKISLDAKLVEKNATRINQLSYMISDYHKLNTSAYKLNTEALNKIWLQPEQFTKRTMDLMQASANLKKIAKSGDEAQIKKAIGGVGRTCGGCHDDFKKD